MSPTLGLFHRRANFLDSLPQFCDTQHTSSLVGSDSLLYGHVPSLRTGLHQRTAHLRFDSAFACYIRLTRLHAQVPQLNPSAPGMGYQVRLIRQACFGIKQRSAEQLISLAGRAGASPAMSSGRSWSSGQAVRFVVVGIGEWSMLLNVDGAVLTLQLSQRLHLLSHRTVLHLDDCAELPSSPSGCIPRLGLYHLHVRNCTLRMFARAD